MAWGFAVLWFGAMALFFRVAPAPSPLPQEVPVPLSWWPASAGAATTGNSAIDVRALWTPSAFALASPAGFSHSQRSERARLTPPVQVARPDAAFLDNPRPAAAIDLLKPERIRLASSGDPVELTSPISVFPPRIQEEAGASLSFPDGWEPRLFSGIDLNYASWSEMAWNAQVEIHFDEKGIPISVLLARSSGLVDVDRRLARSLSGWRLLEPTAPRTGLVVWACPHRAPLATLESAVDASGEEGGAL